ncbi:MAG: PKD domain-containing protein [Reichenbachiella sp.]
MKKMRLIFGMGCLFMMSMIATSCDDVEDVIGGVEDPVASFQATVDETDFLQVSFANFSLNTTSYAWTFGDDAGTSTEVDPIYTYATDGTYTVTLVASNDAGESATFTDEVTVTDPNAALTLLTGAVSKTWKLYAEPDSTSMWKTGDGAWPGLKNDGGRPCLYNQTFTFGKDLSYVFDDAGSFWGEYGVWGTSAADSELFESCFDATAANMENADGVDVSAWLSGTHSFEYDTQSGSLALTGDGVWIGISKLTTTEEGTVPVASVTCDISIDDSNEKYDLMTVTFTYASSVWNIRYASYHDVNDEPTIVTDFVEVPVEDNIDELTLDTFSHTFASEAGAVSLDRISGGSTIALGVADPADASATAVGEFYKSADQYQEAKLQLTENDEVFDIGFDNITTVSIEVYLPSSNDYSGDLTQGVMVGLANELGNSGNWWEDTYNYTSATDLALDTWHTVVFTLATDNSRGEDPTGRKDLDLVFLQVGGGGHTAEGTFYVRNLIFE